MTKHALLAAVAAIGLATSAQAYTVTVDSTLPANLNYFGPYIGNSGTWSDTAGNLWSGDGAVFAGGTTIPAVRVAPPGGAAYMAVTGEETLSLASAVTSFSLDWGSPDAFNNLIINGVAVNGSAINTLGGPWVTFADLPAFSLIEWTSKLNGVANPAFEFSLDPPGRTGAAPEPSTWAMLLLGFAGLGFVAKRKANVARLASI